MRFLMIAFFLIVTSSLMAHGSQGSGIMAGLTHPIFGLDHLLAIFAMGLYTKLHFRDEAWPIILSFVFAMIIGGLLGIESEPLSFTEAIIIASVIFYGFILGLNFKIGRLGFTIIGILFAFFHGHAHGVEMPITTEPIQYVPGYALGALIIAAVGEFIGRHMGPENKTFVQVIGGFIVVLGTMALIG